MKAGKITAKLRDAVKVCFMVEGEEVKRYKNIEMPDALKDLEIRDFHFNVLADGKIEFWLHFDQGILPGEWPECRERKTRTSKVELQAVDATEALNMHQPSAKPTETLETNESATEPVEAIDTIEPGLELMKAIETDAVPAVAQRKRGRKPGRYAQVEPSQADVAV